jgi:hypothetical protein
VWTVFISSGKGQARCCEHGIEPFGFTNSGECLDSVHWSQLIVVLVVVSVIIVVTVITLRVLQQSRLRFVFWTVTPCNLVCGLQ